MSAAGEQASGTLARNTTWLAVGRIASHLFSVVLTVVVARGLGTTGFGQYAFVMSVVVIGNVVTTFGTESLLVREIAAKRGDPARLVTVALALQLVLSAGFVFLVVVGARWLPGRTGDTVYALRVFAVALFPLAFSSVCSAALRAWERMDLSAVLTVGTAVLQAIVALGVVRAGAGLPQLMFGLLLAQVVAAALAWHLCRLAQPGFALAVPAAAVAPPLLARMLARAWPLALLGGLAILSQRIGVLLLTFLAGDTSAGWFAAALRVVEGLKLTHYAWLGALTPLAARLVAEGMSGADTTPPDLLPGLLRKSRFVLVALGVGAALAANVFATPVIMVLYGTAYRPAIAALRILSWALVPFAAAAPTSLALVSTGHERVVVRASALGVAVTISVGVLLIPRIGVDGACVAVLVGEVARSALLLLAAGRTATPRFAPDAAA